MRVAVIKFFRPFLLFYGIQVLALCELFLREFPWIFRMLVTL